MASKGEREWGGGGVHKSECKSVCIREWESYKMSVSLRAAQGSKAKLHLNSIFATAWRLFAYKMKVCVLVHLCTSTHLRGMYVCAYVHELHMHLHV